MPFRRKYSIAGRAGMLMRTIKDKLNEWRHTSVRVDPVMGIKVQ
jgi:hypothetical protein